MNLKRLKELYLMYIKQGITQVEREMIIEQIVKILAEINDVNKSYINDVTIDRFNNRINYYNASMGMNSSFKFIGNTYYINRIKLILN